MQPIWILIIVISLVIFVPIWLYLIAYMSEMAKLNAHRDWRRDNGGK